MAAGHAHHQARSRPITTNVAVHGRVGAQARGAGGWVLALMLAAGQAAWAQPRGDGAGAPAAAGIEPARRPEAGAIDAFALGQRARAAGDEARAQRLEAALLELDRKTRLGPVAPGAPPWERALADEFARRRERRLGSTLRAMAGHPVDPANPDDAADLDQAARAAGEVAAEFEALRADARRVDRALSQGRLGDEASGEPGAWGLISRWEERGLLREPGVQAALGPMVERARIVAAIERIDDSQRLLELAEPGQAQAPSGEVVIAAWRRLGQRLGLAWPLTARELTEDSRLSERVLAVAGSMQDRERAEALRAEVAAERRRRLVRMLTLADTVEQLAAAESELGARGVRVEELEPRIRFNLLLAGLKRALSPEAAPSDEQARLLAGRFIEQARALPSGVSFLAGAQKAMSSVEQTLSASPPLPAQRAPRPADLGPGATGRFRGRVDGERLVFDPLTPGPPLEFVRLDGPGLSPLYVGTTEVSVSQFIGIAKAAGLPLSALLPPTDPAVDTRLGPRTWEWDARGTAVVPARQWLAGIGAGAKSQYEGGVAPAPPTGEHPMQWISPSVAAAVAAAAGCRLPTVAEWRGIDAAFGGSVAEAASNLRDRTWARHAGFVDSQLRAGRAVQPADAGSYAPGGAGRITDRDDGVLWLGPVGLGGGAVVHHVRGNVAEWVLDAGGAGPVSAREAEGFVRSHAGGIAAAGGSALSDPGAGPIRPVGLVEGAEGFADVGFRLVFPARVEAPTNVSLGARLTQALTPTPFVPPR